VSPLRAVVLGAAGYTGGELCRLLLGHPQVRLARAVSRSQAGQRLDLVHRHLRGATELEFAAADPAEALEGMDVAFLALQHGESGEVVAGLRELLARPKAPLLVDLSGDFRLQDPAEYRAHYGREHPAPDLLPTFVYGLPELAAPGALPGARRISNPGCFATAAALAAAPLAAARAVRGPIVIAAVTGASGSGTRPSEVTHFPARAGNFRAYRVLSHQHEPEVLQTLARLAGEGCAATPTRPAAPAFSLVLTTHSAPLTRGIYATAAAELESEAAVERVRDELARRFARTRFVRPCPRPPELLGLTGTNFADLHAAFRGRHVVVTCALDNLVKGAAGQAVQNMNLALGLPEDAGLGFLGLWP
jgi:N-acetyl-gamma-glutamyl-phosphate reductase